MSERSEEQTARDKAAVEAMKHAKSNMDSALSRVAALELALNRAIGDLRRAKDDISPKVYCYPNGSDRQTVHQRIEAEIAYLSKVL